MKRATLMTVLLIGGTVASAGAPERRSRSLAVVATGYCPCSICCEDSSDGITSTGRDAYLPGVAVDPDVIKLGSRLDIPGYDRGANNNGSWILADDVGGRIKGSRIDVRFKTHAEAQAYGRRRVVIRVWDQ